MSGEWTDMSIGPLHLSQSSPGVEHHGVLLPDSLSFILFVPSTSSTSLSRLFPLWADLPTEAGGGGDASNEMKSSCPSNCALALAGVATSPVCCGVESLILSRSDPVFAFFDWGVEALSGAKEVLDGPATGEGDFTLRALASCRLKDVLDCSDTFGWVVD